MARLRSSSLSGDLSPTRVGGSCFASSLARLERGWLAPGCLIGESEERETWTAESLRAAHVRGSIYVSRWQALAPCGWTRLRRYTFQVNTKKFREALNAAAMQTRRGGHARGSLGGTSSNVVISRN